MLVIIEGEAIENRFKIDCVICEKDISRKDRPIFATLLNGFHLKLLWLQNMKNIGPVLIGDIISFMSLCRMTIYYINASSCILVLYSLSRYSSKLQMIDLRKKLSPWSFSIQFYSLTVDNNHIENKGQSKIAAYPLFNNNY